MTLSRDPRDHPRHTWRVYLLVAVLFQIGIGIPSLLILMAIGSFNLLGAVSLFCFVASAAPVYATFSWLVDRGTWGEQADLSLTILIGLPVRFYGLLVGLFVGKEAAGTAGAIGGIVVMFVVTRYLWYRYGLSLAKRVSSVFS